MTIVCEPEHSGDSVGAVLLLRGTPNDDASSTCLVCPVPRHQAFPATMACRHTPPLHRIPIVRPTYAHGRL